MLGVAAVYLSNVGYGVISSMTKEVINSVKDITSKFQDPVSSSPFFIA